jgi:glutamate--cysteine ligase
MSEIFNFLTNLLNCEAKKINDWFENHHIKNPPFFYNSVDIRDSGYKIAPIDTNIFPAGFNNLSSVGQKNATLEIKKFIAGHHANVKKIIILAESHTRNLFYLQNLYILKSLFPEYDIECSYLAQNGETDLSLTTSEGKNINLYALKRNQNHVYIKKDFIADLIIVNNDLTTGSPKILENIKQPLIPTLSMGWHNRKKYHNFLAYNHIAKEFAKEFNFDPFLIATEVGFCKDVNFKERKGLECIALNLQKTLTKIANKYDELKIDTKPYIYLKANRGTYGMGIMVIQDAEGIFSLNKKLRNQMNIIKQNTLNAEILIQEGIPTIDKFDNHSAEPFIYLVNGKPVGSILRINSNKDHLSNLNSVGAKFVSIDQDKNYQNKIPTYNLIAKLAALAAAIEHKFDDE